MQTDLSIYNNEWYKPGSLLKRVCWAIFGLLFFRNPALPFYSFKRFTLRAFGAKIGNGVVIKPGVIVKYPWFLSIGNYTWVGEGVWIDNLGKVEIGSNVCISQGVLLLSGNHDYTKQSFDLIVKPITIEDGVWIGAKAIVCGGALCRSHSVLTAGSIMSKEMAAYSIYKGNPAEKIKDRKIIA